LRFRRRDDGSAEHEVFDGTGALRVIAVPPPDDLAPASEPMRDRLLRWVAEHAPGTTARAIRIALGVER
ncbi:MAG TPA: hypothetical protein VFI96_07825, partial [Longimicrobiaceae bacterium]|nr:hypothetical protein [Longimicrobiaceae bacterium]